MRPCHYIDSEAPFRELIERLTDLPTLALDTESNSFYVYYERVCLVQLSTETEDFALDPFKVDLKALGPIMANPRTELVIHAADYDVRCLKRDFGFTFGRIFDTMLAAKLLGRKELGLAALLKNELGVHHPKEHQRSDWGQRPLSGEQLAYAYADTRHLVALRERLQAALVAEGKVAAAEKLFARQAACEPRPKQFEPNDFREIKGVRSLDPEGKQIARALYVLREELARAWDRPPFKVFGNDQIVAMATVRPTTLGEVERIKGMGRSTLQKAGDRVVEALTRSRSGGN